MGRRGKCKLGQATAEHATADEARPDQICRKVGLPLKRLLKPTLKLMLKLPCEWLFGPFGALTGRLPLKCPLSAP